jgi:hypothetical protein
MRVTNAYFSNTTGCRTEQVTGHYFVAYLTAFSQLHGPNERKTVKAELGKIWKERVLIYFKVLSQRLSGGSEGKHSHDKRALGSKSNPRSSHIVYMSARYFSGLFYQMECI